MAYQKTRDALALYDMEPTDASRDLAQVAFYLEAPTNVRARIQNPTIGQIKAVLELDGKHEWEFYANGSFCRKCGAAIGSPYSCR